MTKSLDPSLVRSFVAETWSHSILPALEEYVRIPNQSPYFDPQWAANGHMERAVTLVADWIRAQDVPGLRLEVVRLEGRTPLLFAEVPGDSPHTVLLYGHLDKQPPMHGWHAGLGPWTPVVRDGMLYGRGAADDGYSAFAAVAAIHAVKRQGAPCPRCVIVIEACEESGSFDLPAYIEALAERIGTPDLVVCLDSGCGTYDRLWLTVSLRGLVSGTLAVSTLTEGVHSGGAGGIVPSSFRIARSLLGRLEDADSGAILLREAEAAIPAQRRRETAAAADVLGASLTASFPFQPGARPVVSDPTELLLNRTWRPQLEVTGAEGLPPVEKAGNVLRPETTLKLSLRLPPTADARAAAAGLRQLLEAEPPYAARVSFDSLEAADGWNAPPLAPWLGAAVRAASRWFFDRDECCIGEGGTIPFMAMLGRRFPRAQFVITGVLGPHSNAHGPNEFLHLGAAENLTACVATILSACAATPCP